MRKAVLGSRSTVHLDYNKSLPSFQLIIFIYLSAELTGEWSVTKTAQIQRNNSLKPRQERSEDKKE